MFKVIDNNVKKHPIQHLINWYLGTHCFPKCLPDTTLEHKRKIEEFFLSNKQSQDITYKDFLKIIREQNVCNLSEAEYRRNVYREPLVGSPKSQNLSQIEALALTLLWIFRFEEVIGSEKIYRSWKGYDFDVLKQLLAKGFISYSYKSKSVIFRDKGVKLAPRVAEKVLERLKKD